MFGFAWLWAFDSIGALVLLSSEPVHDLGDVRFGFTKTVPFLRSHHWKHLTKLFASAIPLRHFGSTLLPFLSNGGSESNHWTFLRSSFKPQTSSGVKSPAATLHSFSIVADVIPKPAPTSAAIAKLLHGVVKCSRCS